MIPGSMSNYEYDVKSDQELLLTPKDAQGTSQRHQVQRKVGRNSIFLSPLGNLGSAPQINEREPTEDSAFVANTNDSYP